MQKYKLVDPTKDKHFNQYKNMDIAKAKTKNKFGSEQQVQQVLGHSDGW